MWRIILTMPAKNILKEYLKNGVYHVYNRGVNKQDIFFDRKDYATFLLYLKLYLENQNDSQNLDPQERKWVDRKNFYNKIDLLCYCLMPNHFHLLIKQKEERGITDFMRCIATNYSMYFNKRYDRVGTLFQGRYKAVLVKEDNYLLHLSRYIHANPFIKSLSKGRTLAKLNNKLEKYPYSSYASYTSNKNVKWIKPDFILEYFEENKNTPDINKHSYREFVTDYENLSDELINNLTLEN